MHFRVVLVAPVCVVENSIAHSFSCRAGWAGMRGSVLGAEVLLRCGDAERIIRTPPEHGTPGLLVGLRQYQHGVTAS